MVDAYIGEIRMFGGTFAPQGWAICDGKELPIEQFVALFTLINTTYGGDGTQTFMLPDLQGRAPLHRGKGPGISQDYKLGQKHGAETVTLSPQQLPVHQHVLQVSKGEGTSPNPENAVIGARSSGVPIFKGREAPETKMPATMVSAVGGGQPHPNRMPYLAITFIIALDGIFPPHP